MDDEEKKKLKELMREVEERDKGTWKGEGFTLHFNLEDALAAARKIQDEKKKLFEERKQQREAKKREEASKQDDSDE